MISFRLFTNAGVGEDVVIHLPMERPETRYIGAKSNIKSVLSDTDHGRQANDQYCAAN
jgi:hypothetical protein